MAGTNSDISDYSIDEMASIVSDTLLNSEDAEERSDETRKYLEYENRNVTVYVYMNSSDETDYDYVAIDENGDYVTSKEGNILAIDTINDCEVNTVDIVSKEWIKSVNEIMSNDRENTISEDTIGVSQVTEE